MVSLIAYHVALFGVVLLLWQSIRLNVPTTFNQLFVLSLAGSVAAGILCLGSLQYASQGLLFQGGLFLLGASWLVGRQRIDGRRRLRLAFFLLSVAIVFLGTGIEGLVIEPRSLVVKRYEIVSPKIGKPMRIVFLSDFQTDSIGPYERETLQRLQAEKPDLILLGGDYLQARTKKHEKRLIVDFNNLLKDMKLEAPLGVYAIQGNQELGAWSDWTRYFEGTAIIPIKRTQTLSIGEIRLTLLGVHDSFRTLNFADRRYRNRFRLIVGHAPCFAIRNQDADLLLAGHTHGGQVWIPGFGPISTMSKGLPRTWASGPTRLANGAMLFVSNGSGMERGRAPRIRLFCRPDFLVFDIVPVKDLSIPSTTPISDLAAK